MSKTTVINSSKIDRKWYVIDASSETLGRVSTKAANLLIGKGKVDYTPHVDNGDFVIVINASKLKVTGNKELSKIYYRHSSHPGSLKEKTLKELKSENPEQVIINSVKGMLPKNKLQSGRIGRLKVYANENHEHTAQKPQEVK